MRGQRDICLLCRHAVRPLRLNGFAKRNASAQKEPYVLSRTAIDLDAMDSKFVKRYEEMEFDTPKSEQIKIKAAPPLIDPGWIKRTKKTDSGGKDLTSFKDTVTAPDLLAYALIGATWKQSTYYTQLQQLFKAHRVRDVDISEIKFKKLTHEFSTNPSITLERAGFSSQETQNTKRDLEGCTSWSELRRIVSTLSSTTKGCEFLAENSDSLAHSITECRKTWAKRIKATPHGVLLLLNNLTLNFGARGIRIGPRLCNAGLYYAAKTDTLAAVSMYLNISLENKYPTNWHTARALNWLVAHFRRRYSLDICVPEKGMRGQADLISTLISGWANDNGPSSRLETQSSFADLISHGFDASLKDSSFDIHSTYLLMLGEIGYGQTLLHEWERLGDPRLEDPDLPGQYISAMAFILANNRPQALSILEAAPTKAETARPSSAERTQYLFIRHYDTYKLLPTPKLKKKIQQPIPKDPSEALKAIDNLLVTDLNHPLSTYGQKHVVHWATVNGHEGLQIRDQEGIELYFKPAT